MNKDEIDAKADQYKPEALSWVEWRSSAKRHLLVSEIAQDAAMAEYFAYVQQLSANGETPKTLAPPVV